MFKLNFTYNSFLVLLYLPRICIISHPNLLQVSAKMSASRAEKTLEALTMFFGSSSDVLKHVRSEQCFLPLPGAGKMYSHGLVTVVAVDT